MPVWLSFEFTYLSNVILYRICGKKVWLSFEFTYLSNRSRKLTRWEQFDYPLNLHISQTLVGLLHLFLRFDYPLNLHISQTKRRLNSSLNSLIILWIYISLKQRNHPQLSVRSLIILWIYISLKHPEQVMIGTQVWLSFEFTYLSNSWSLNVSRSTVWLSFEFTYLSNRSASVTSPQIVWLSFEFTYLSNEPTGVLFLL